MLVILFSCAGRIYLFYLLTLDLLISINTSFLISKTDYHYFDVLSKDM